MRGFYPLMEDLRHTCLAVKLRQLKEKTKETLERISRLKHWIDFSYSVLELIETNVVKLFPLKKHL